MDPGAVGRPRGGWGFWCACAALLVLLGLAAARARFTSDLKAMLPTNDAELNRLVGFLDARGTTRLLAIEATTAPGVALEAAKPELARLVADLAPRGATPLPQPGAAEMAHLVQVIEAKLPVLLTAEQLAALATDSAPAGLRAQLARIRQKATDPDDVFTASAARADLLGLGYRPLQALEAISAGAAYDHGLIVHPDGRSLLLPLQVDFDPGESGRTDALMTAADAAVARAAAAGVTLSVVGSYRHFRDNAVALRADSMTTVPLGAALIALLLWSLARSWTGVLAMYLPAALSLIGAVAVLSVCGGMVALPLVGFAATLLGVAVDYGIQMTTALRAGDAAPVHRPLLMSWLVSLCAFAGLLTSPVPALASLGVLVLGGLATAYLAARWLLPRVVAAKPRPDPWRRWTLPLLAWCERFPRRRLLLGALITLALAPGLGRLAMVSDLQRMDGSQPATRAALSTFLERWGSLESTNFLVCEQPEADAALDAIVTARTRLALPPSRLEQFMPGADERARRQAAWNAFWTAHGDAFRADLAVACAELGLRPAAFAASLARYQPVAEPIPLTLADWDGTPLTLALAGLLHHGDGAWQAASPVDRLSRPETIALPARVAELAPGPVWVATRIHMAERLVAVLSSDLARRGLLIALTVTVAVVLLVRRARPCLAMLLPPAVALAWTFGLLGWMGEELTPFSVLVAAFVGGIGIDCAIFLAQGEQRARLVSPVIACIATAIAGTSTMIVAHHPLLAGVGLTLTIGMGSCLVACLLLTPALAGRGAPPR